MSRINQKYWLLSLLLLGFLGICFGLGSVYFGRFQPTRPQLLPPLPTSTPPTPQRTMKTSQESPDGKAKLHLFATAASPTQTTYRLALDETTVWQTHLTDTQLSLPFNAWSPDNKYFFIEEKTATAANYLVFTAQNQDQSPLLEIQQVALTKELPYTIKEVTGWAAPTLLLVNTLDADGGIGPSFWLDVTHQSFTRLATQF